jgi:hypothetical protein
MLPSPAILKIPPASAKGSFFAFHELLRHQDELLNGTLDLGLFYEDVGLGSNLSHTLWHLSRCFGSISVDCTGFPDFITPGKKFDSFGSQCQSCISQIFEKYLCGNQFAWIID